MNLLLSGVMEASTSCGQVERDLDWSSGALRRSLTLALSIPGILEELFPLLLLRSPCLQSDQLSSLGVPSWMTYKRLRKAGGVDLWRSECLACAQAVPLCLTEFGNHLSVQRIHAV